MVDAFTRLIGSFGTFILAATLTFLIALGASFGFRYYEVYTINSNIENLMSDLLDYAAMHNGFNDPYDGSYTFTQVLNEKIAQYKLQGHIQGGTPQFSPAPGVDSLKRAEEIFIIVTPIFPVMNPFSDGTRIGKPKDSRGVTHGYVKVTGKDKSELIDKPVIDIMN